MWQQFSDKELNKLLMLVCYWRKTTYRNDTHMRCDFDSRSWQGVFDTTLCDKVYQWLAAGRCFLLRTLVSNTGKTDRHDITKILLKVETITPEQIYHLNVPINKDMVWIMHVKVSVFTDVRLVNSGHLMHRKALTVPCNFEIYVLWNLQTCLEETFVGHL